MSENRKKDSQYGYTRKIAVSQRVKAQTDVLSQTTTGKCKVAVRRVYQVNILSEDCQEAVSLTAKLCVDSREKNRLFHTSY